MIKDDYPLRVVLVFSPIPQYDSDLHASSEERP